MDTHYKALKIWQKGIEIVKEVYKLTQLLPKEEMFGLASQMRRSAVSIPSNIAEGYTRQSNKELIQFLFVSKSSAAELETQLIITTEIYGLETINIQTMLTEELKMLSSFISAKKTKISS